MLDIEQISAACGHVTSINLNGAKSAGTGYLIGPQRIATCAHVVDRALSERIRVAFDGAEMAAAILCMDRENDCAVLDLETAPGALPLTLGGGCTWKSARDSYGFPGVVSGTGVTCSGIVSNTHGRDDLKRPVLELTSDTLLTLNAGAWVFVADAELAGGRQKSSTQLASMHERNRHWEESCAEARAQQCLFDEAWPTSLQPTPQVGDCRSQQAQVS